MGRLRGFGESVVVLIDGVVVWAGAVMLAGEVVLVEVEVALKRGMVSVEVPLKGKSTVEGLETV